MTKPTIQPPNHLTARLSDILAIASLWLLVIGFFWKIALAGRVLADGDIFTYFYPYWAEATRAIHAGRLPLWNPYLFMGVPFLANSQVGVFYPLNWPLWLLFPAYRSVHLTIVLHLCLAALNAYLWGRVSLRLGRVGAWTVGAILALGGYLSAQVEHVNQLQGLAWLPLMLMLYDWQIGRLQTCPEQGRRVADCRSASPQVCKSNRRVSKYPTNFQLPTSNLRFIGLVVVIALVFLAGHTQTAFISVVGLAAYGLGPALWKSLRRLRNPAQGWWRPLAQRIVVLAGAVGLGAMLAAVQLVPTWELARLSIRAGGLPFNDRVSFSLSPFYLTRALLPGFATPVIPEHIEHVAYVGVIGLVLAAVAVSTWRAGESANQRDFGELSRAVSASPISNFQPPISKSQIRKSAILLLALGLFLSLGLYNPVYLVLARLPGFAYFRVPARWLALYGIGAAALAGWGVQTLWERRGRLSWRFLLILAAALVAMAGWAVVGPRIGEGGRTAWPTAAGWGTGIALALGLLTLARRAPRVAATGLLALLVAELFASGLALPYNRATAPQAFTSLRPAIAHLLADSPPSLAGERQGGGSRFLSVSDMTFDPGDLAEIRVIYGPQLSAAALYDYVIAAKQKEVLSPDLPLAFGVPAVDGYDGGVLPLARYVALQRLFLPDDRVSIDGRLRENLTAIPDGRWLNLFNVRYVITDKLRDAWLDDVFYDLQFGAQLAQGGRASVAHVPQFEATALGLVSYLDGAAALADGAPVGLVEVGFGGGITRTFELRAGRDTAEGLYGSDVAHAQATVGGHFWAGEPAGNDYVTRLRWATPATPVTVVVRAVLPEGEWVVRGVSLIDERTGSFQALVLSDRGRFRLAHSGDVKIYANLDVLPRAFVACDAIAVPGETAALAAMQSLAFDPAQTVVLEQPASAGLALSARCFSAGQAATVLSYRPERIEISATLDAPGTLVLTDAWYPGWQATVDGETTPVLRADLLFRAVRLTAGEHRVVFTFRPASVKVGAVVSLVALVGLLAGLLVGWAVLSKARRGDIMDARIGERIKKEVKR